MGASPGLTPNCSCSTRSQACITRDQGARDCERMHLAEGEDLQESIKAGEAQGGHRGSSLDQ